MEREQYIPSDCKNCCYFSVTDDENWNGLAHCCFNEWGHGGDGELAPCDEDAMQAEYESYQDEYPYDCE